MGQVLDDLLGVLCLPSSRLSRAENGLILTILKHAAVRALGHGIDVRWHLVSLLAPVHFNNGLRVDRQLLVRVNDHTEEARVGINEPRVVALSQIVQNRGLVEAGELSHIFCLAELGWVHALDLVPGQPQAPPTLRQLHFCLLLPFIPQGCRLEPMQFRGHPHHAPCCPLHLWPSRATYIWRPGREQEWLGCLRHWAWPGGHLPPRHGQGHCGHGLGAWR